MKINVKDSKKTKKLAKEFHMGPTAFLNDIVDNLSFPPGFKNEARKHSFGTAFFRALRGSYHAKMIEGEIYAILGKHDYHIDDGEIDLQKRTCWFLMYFTEDEKIIDLDSVHFQLNEGSSALVSVTRTIDGIKNWKNLDKAEAAAQEHLDGYFDSRELDVEFDTLDDQSVILELTIEDEWVGYLPKLKEINNVIDEAEYKFRKALE